MSQVQQEVTWRQVFDTNHTWYGHIEEGRSAAWKANYPYFCWNGRIYESETCSDTCLTVEDVK